MRTRAIVITGPFDDADLARFTALMREIERTRPDQTFSFVVDDADGQGVEEAVKIMQRIFPRRERTQ
jgi:hypothetical protein